MTIETVRMSSKGQIVIPQDIREELQVDEGTLFAVVGSKDTIILKKIFTPDREELIQNLKNFAAKATLKMQKLGIKEEDIPYIVEKHRKSKQ